MAPYFSNGVQVTIVPAGGGAAVDISEWVKSALLTRNVNELDITAMGDSGVELTAGLEANSLALEVMSDWATNASAAVIDALFGQRTTVTLKPKAGATSAANPLYTFTVLVNGTTVGGATQDLATMTLNWNVCGTVVKTTA